MKARIRDIDENKLFRALGEVLLSDMDLMLIRMTHSKSPTQEKLDEFLKDWDIEVNGGHKAILLAYFMNSHPEMHFPEYVLPRLQGLQKYYRFKNVGLIAQFVKIGKRLKDAGIDVTLFKGGAMKYLRPELPRAMSDIDVIIDADRYREAGMIIKGMGYSVSWDEHSFDVHKPGSEEGILDVHRFIPMLSGKEKDILPEVFARSRKETVFGLDAGILCEEDLFFVSLVNMARNLMDNTSHGSVVHAVFDVEYLSSKPGFNWDIVRENARKTGTEKLLVLSINFLNWVVPGLLPDLFKVSEKEMQDTLVCVAYRRSLFGLQQRSHELSVSHVLKEPGLLRDFLEVRPKYTFLKLFRNKPRIAKRILQKNEASQGKR